MTYPKWRIPPVTNTEFHWKDVYDMFVHKYYIEPTFEQVKEVMDMLNDGNMTLWTLTRLSNIAKYKKEVDN